MTEMHTTPRTSDDPIFPAIAEHRASVQTVDRLAAGMEDPDHRPMQAALMAECAAAKALIEKAPTTQAGLRALGKHLREDRNSNARWFINRTVTTDDGYTYTISGTPECVDWLIAQRAVGAA